VRTTPLGEAEVPDVKQRIHGSLAIGGSVIVEGIQVGEKAVIAPGVTLSKGIPVYDCVHEKVLEKGAPIPARAVVVPGSRPAKGKWAEGLGLNMSCALIVKYRDEKSEASLELESLLR